MLLKSAWKLSVVQQAKETDLIISRVFGQIISTISKRLWIFTIQKRTLSEKNVRNCRNYFEWQTFFVQTKILFKGDWIHRKTILLAILGFSSAVWRQTFWKNKEFISKPSSRPTRIDHALDSSLFYHNSRGISVNFPFFCNQHSKKYDFMFFLTVSFFFVN